MDTVCYELYVISTDALQDQAIDKIVMKQQEMERYLELFSKYDDIEVTGLYGSLIEIQKNLYSGFRINSLSQATIGNGKIIGIQQDQKAILCLIFQEEFFLKKPINEKSIQITLARIFCDLNHHIQLCFSSQVYFNWYDGEYIPFSEMNVLKRQEYFIDCSKNKEIIELKLPLVIEKDYWRNYQLFPQLNTPFILKGSLKIQTVNEQIQLLEKKFQEIAFKIFCGLEKNEQPNFRQLLEYSSSFKEYDPNFDKKSLEILYYQIQEFFNSYSKENNKEQTLEKVKNLAQKLFYENEPQLKKKCQFQFQRCVFKVQQVQDSNIKQVYFETEKTIHTLNLNFVVEHVIDLKFVQFLEKQILQLQAIFRTKENSELFIFYDISKKQSQLYVLPKNQTKWILIGQIVQLSQAVYFFNQKTNQLFVFNALNNKQINRFEISDKKIITQQIFCQQVYNNKMIIIEQVAYLSFTKNFVFLLKDSKPKDSLFVLNEEEKKIREIVVQNLNDDFKYQQIQLHSCPSGKYFYLSNLKQCNMLDCNFKIVKSIQINGRLSIMSDGIDIFLICLFDKFKSTNTQLSVVQLQNVIEVSSLRKVSEFNEEIEGNPAFDLFKDSQVKFGPLASFLTKTEISQKKLYLKENTYMLMLQKYMKLLNIEEYEILINDQPQFQKEDINNFKGICYSRVPIQICTIENSNITPLVDGFRKELFLYQKMEVSEKAELLKLGFLEKYLNSRNEKVFVVSIIGKQSSGKSYLLNRLFGTRYSVAACRCTDGVWASLAKIDDQMFLILDCEGLFSSIRSQKEEVQLLALLTALSDMTFLNQDLTFNRYLNELLENLTAASDQLVGDTLFKGVLNIVLRDISAQDNCGVDEELISNINLLRSGDNQDVIFLRKLFNSRFYVEKLFNFENKKFDDQIVSFRNRILKVSAMSNRWQNGEQLISSLKILLCQLEMSDKTNSSLLQQQQKINQFFKTQKNIWIEFILSLYPNDHVDQAQEIQKQSQFFGESQDTKLKIFKNQETRNTLSQSIWLNMNSDLKFETMTKDHNNNLQLVNKELNKKLVEKKDDLLIVSDSQFPITNKTKEIVDFFNAKRLQFLNYMLKQINSFTFCMEKCEHCFLKCTKFQIHDSESKHQLEIIQRQIFEISEKQKEFDTIGEEEFSFLQGESRKNQLQITNFQQQLKFYEMYNESQSLKIQSESLEKEIEQFLPLEQQQQSFKSITNNLQKKDYDEKNFEHSLENQTQNFQCLKNIKQELIKIIVKTDDEIKNYENLIKSKQLTKISSNKQLEVKFSEASLIRENLQSQEASVELNRNEQQKKKMQLYHKQQFAQYENINQMFPNISIMSDKEKVLFLKVQYQKNFEQAQEIEKEIQINKQEQANWIEDTAPFQSDGLTADGFFQIFKDYQNIQQDIEQRILQQKAILEKQTKFYRLNSLSLKFKNQFKLEKQQIEQKINQLEDQQMKQKYIQIEQIKELMENNPNSRAEQIFEEYKNKKNQEKQELDFQLQQVKYKKEKLENVQFEIDFYQQYLQLKNEIESEQLIISQVEQEIDRLTEQLKYIEVFQQEQMNQLTSLETELLELKKFKDECVVKQKIIDCSIQQCQKIIDQFPKYLEMLNNQKLLIEKIERIENEIMNVEENFTKDPQKAEEIQKQVENIQFQNSKLEQQIQSYIQFQLLKSKLSKLEADKNNVLLSKEEHSCQRPNHICDEMCCICSGESCKLLAGHNGEHLCHKEEHLCGQDCSIQSCSEKCSLKRNHQERHLCQKAHLCNSNCQYCTKQCQINITTMHDFHTCGEIKCNQKCFLCESYCKENHDHSQFKSTYHFCQKQEHTCNNKCEKSGICKLVYQQVESEWISALSSFKYINYIQLDAGKQNCILSIQSEKLFHEDYHTCFQDTDLQFHVCGEECPECQAFCTKQFGHSGKHSTHQHRNKEKQCFTLEVGIIEEIDIDETKKYQVGDSAQPETCSESCKRRGRSHFHLVECKGGEQCLEKFPEYSNRARHSKISYQNYEDISFDEILCNSYWEFQNWMHPINQPRLQEETSRCNYYCGICDEKEKKFCIEEAWHTDSAEFKDHNFSCTSKHKFVKGLSICFVIDSTGSMASYLKGSIQAIKQIMMKALMIPTLYEKMSIEFSVVSYKDHGDPIVVSYQDFSSDQVCIDFLDQIRADGGADGPEAMFDGLEKAMKLKWKEGNSKILYLIADSPPHGTNPLTSRVYHNQKDDYPNGCPCRLTQTPILKQMKEQDIEFKIIKLNSELELTIAEFRYDYTALQVLDIRNQSDHFVPTIVNDVCKKLVNNEITYKQKD